MPESRFPTTRWSLVLDARKEGEEGENALSKLCESYSGPLYSFVRRRGFSPDDARDLTQGFLLSLLERKDLRRVDRSAGRFRSFLCASVKHFISNEMDRARALKRGGGAITISWDAMEAEKRYALEPREDLDPEKVFERRWAFTVLQLAERRMESELSNAGRLADFEQLRPFVAGTNPRGSYADAAARLGVSEDAVKMKVHRLRRKYGQAVRREIADTVADPTQVDDELRHLLAVIRS